MISSQITVKDENWEILEKIPAMNNLSKDRLLIRCKICGEVKEIGLGTIYKDHIKCQNCENLKEIGTIYGNLEIVSYAGRSRLNEKLYISKCINCGHIFEAKRLGDIKKSSKTNRNTCKYCTIVGDNSGINKHYLNYKIGAEKRGLEFKLSPEEFTSLIYQNCAYCNKPPQELLYKSGKSIKNINYVNGIDRIDSSRGYLLDNCVPCCTMCNRMKLNYTKSDFLSHIAKIYNFSVKGSETIENTTNVGSE